MRIQTVFFAFFLLFFAFTVDAQDAITTSHEAVIWRGFSHNWTYNHRINRLGDYVQYNNGKPLSCHTAASGMGADSAFFTSHYSSITSQNTYFKEGVVNIKIYGKEKQLLTKNVEIALPASEELKNQDQYITLLNGFDLQAIGHADKVQLLRIAIEDAYYASAVNEVRFNVKVSIVVNCQSFECSRFNQQTTYDLNIYYLMLTGERNYLSATPKTVTENYPWDNKNEYQPIDKKQEMTGNREYVFPKATFGIKSLALTLDDAHWMVQTNYNVTPIDYKAEDGRASFKTNVFFKEWQQGMKKMSAMPQHSKFSSKKKGWAVLDMGLVLLQFREAEIIHGKHKGSSFWEGHNTSANSTKAKHVHPIPDISAN